MKNYVKKKQSEKERKKEQEMYQIKYEEIAILSKEEKKNKKIDDLCKLKHFSIALDCINRKPDYYITNYQKFIDADKAIDIAKEYKFYDKSNPRKIYKKSFKEDDDTLPEKWETLFELKCDTEKILNACRIERDNFLNVDEAINISKEYKFYDKSNPRKIYKNSFKEEDNTLPQKWETLFEFKWNTEKILKACKIERVKKMYNEFDKEHDWKYYNELINADNYYNYYLDFNNFVYEYKEKERKKIIEAKIDELNKIVKYIRRNNHYVINQTYYNWNNNITEYEKEIEFSRANIGIKELEKYEELFKGYKQQIIKEKKKEEREEREERQYYNNNSSRNNYSSSSSSNNNNDLKKAYVILCDHCKNKCVYCHKELKGDIGKSTSYGLHKKCQTSSCYICGKTRDTKERQTSYLCKSCYGSRKADNTKCLDCQKTYRN